MERTSGSGVMRLGPLARRLLARRRRWLRWAAVGLAALTLLSAVAQLRHRPAPRQSGGIRVQTAAAPRVVGVADVVPRDMRAVNVIVPAAATFDGRLAPGSRVDVLAAFDLGQDRAVRRVLASGIVLHVTPRTAPAAAVPPLSGDGRFSGAAVDEVALAVPAAREQEIVMAQAFGRVFLAVEPTDALRSASNPSRPRPTRGAASDAALLLRRYVDLPPAAAFSAGPPRWAGAPPSPPPLFGWPAASGTVAPGHATWPSDPPRPSGQPSGIRRDDATVEVIEGTTRTTVEVSP